MGSYHPVVVCVIWNGCSPITGTNSMDSSSPKWMKRHEDGNVSYSRHAEEHALAQLPHEVNVKRLKVFVTRYKKDGTVGLAKPCHHCMEKLMAYGIKTRQIFYTNNDGEMERVR